ncbi:hypothetical protein TrVFT333_009111 [Trichoderma virens FT-333]|nr:hypothetical protein TrVFT333_009111 [Trichoderma virens FT-333]
MDVYECYPHSGNNDDDDYDDIRWNTDAYCEVTAITLTTIITVFDGTATPTDSIETSTESSGGGYEVLKRWFGGSRRTEDEDRETTEQLQGQGLETREVMPPAELDATMEYRGSASVLEGPCSHHPVATRIAEELDGSNAASHNPVSTSQRLEFVAVELPTSVDPGNSPLPRYEDLDTDERHRVFSWAAPESTYRPEKLGIEDSS